MALLFCEGFEGYGTTAGAAFDGDFFSNKWFTENNPNTQIGNGRDSGQSLRCTGAALGAGFNPAGTTVLDSEFVLGFAFRHTANAAQALVALFRINTNNRLNLRLNTDGTFSLYRNNTSLATGTTVLANNAWYYIELKTKIRDGAAGSYDLRINGVTELSNSSVDLVESGPNGLNNIRFAGAGGTTFEIDDLYLLDTSGSSNNDFLGDSKVELLLPDGPGDSTQWTPDAGSNYARVNEAVPDGNSSYVESSTSGADDLYAFSDDLGDGPIHGIQVDVHAITASSSMALLARSDTTTGAGSSKSLTSSYAYYGSIFESNPDTSTSWTKADVLAAQFGIRQVSGTPRVSRIAVSVLRSLVDPFTVEASSGLDLNQFTFLDNSLLTRVGSFVSPSASGTQSISGLGFRPKALLLFPTITTSEGSPDANQAIIHIGAVGAGGGECALGLLGTGLHGACRHQNDRCVMMIDLNGDITGPEAHFVSFDPDGFTIDWDTGGLNRTIHYLALGGIVLEQAEVVELQSPESAEEESYDIGFQPDALLFFSTPVADSNDSHADDPVSLSIGYTDGVRQAVSAIGQWNQPAPGDHAAAAYRVQRNDRVIITVMVDDQFSGTTPDPSIHSDAEFLQMEPDGFTLDWHTVTAQHRFFALALKGGKYHVGSDTQLAPSGAKSTHTPRTRPNGIFAQSVGQAVSDTLNPQWRHSMGIGTSTAQKYFDSYTRGFADGTRDEHNWDDNALIRGFDMAASVNDPRVIRATGVLQSLDVNGFTLDWSVSEGTEREFNYMLFGDDFLGAVDAVTDMEFDQDIDVDPVLNYHAASTIPLAQEARGPFPKSAFNALTALSQALSRNVDFGRSVTDNVALQSNVLGGFSRNVSGASSLDVSDAADLARFATSELMFDQEVAQEVARRVLNTLEMTHEAQIPYSGISHLDLTQEVAVPTGAVSTLLLNHAAAFIPPPGTRLLSSRLTLTHFALVLKTLHLSLATTLNLGQGLAVIGRPSDCVWPDIDPPVGTLSKGIRLIGDTTVDVSRSMNLGDIDRLAFDRIVRETRGGTLHVFADPLWPKTETLVFSLSAVRRTKAHQVIDFMLAHLGREITLETHEGRQWSGFILNPGEAVVEDRPNSYTISVEFEGQKVAAE